MQEDIQVKTNILADATMAFYGDCLARYPELLTDPRLNAIEADAKKPISPEMEAEDNPVYRMLVFLSEYKDCIELASYGLVYDAFEALVAAVRPDLVSAQSEFRL